MAISWCTWTRLSWLYSHHTSCLFLVWAHSDSFRITSNTFFRQFVVPSSHFLCSPFLCNHRNVAIDHDDANVCFPQVQVAVSTFFDALIACRQKSNTACQADAWHAAVASAMLPLLKFEISTKRHTENRHRFVGDTGLDTVHRWHCTKNKNKKPPHYW